MTTIRCLYSCALCGLHRVEVYVPERDPDRQDVVVWLEGTAVPVLVADHHRRSPLCRPTKLSEVLIPIGGEADPVGMALRN